MGLSTFFTQWPFLILFHYAGWETFEIPSLPTLYGLLANSGLDTVLNTAIYVRANEVNSRHSIRVVSAHPAPMSSYLL